MSMTLFHFSDIHFNRRHIDWWDPDEDLRREVVREVIEQQLAHLGISVPGSDLQGQAPPQRVEP